MSLTTLTPIAPCTSSPLLFNTLIATFTFSYFVETTVSSFVSATNALQATPPFVITGLIVINLSLSASVFTTASLDVSERSKSNPSAPTASFTLTVKYLVNLLLYFTSYT